MHIYTKLKYYNKSFKGGERRVYSLSFFEAIERCVNGDGFIRGDKFRDGVYVKKQGETLIAIDAFNSNKVIGNFFISTEIMAQKYKLFDSVLDEELQNDKCKLVFLHNKAS
jgi:hypothetical protein